jgi:hypothetical protein
MSLLSGDSATATYRAYLPQFVIAFAPEERRGIMPASASIEGFQRGEEQAWHRRFNRS